MLGKGLESLIPPQNQSNNESSQNNQGLIINNNNSQNPQANFNDQNNTAQNNNLNQNENLLESENKNFLPEKKEEELLTKEKQELLTPSEQPILLNNTENTIELPKNEEKVEFKKTEENILNNFNEYNNLKNNTKKGESVFYIEVSKIKPNPHQPRKDFNDESINELAESIRQFGIIQPLVVKKIEKDIPTGTEVEYQIIAGERRWLAAKKLGMENVPAIIRKVDADQEGLELAIIENLQRENLNPIETARAFAKLQDDFRLTQREIATRLGKSREVVANALRLLDLPQNIQNAIAEGKISESHGRLLLTIEDKALQQKLFEDLLKANLTTRELKYKINAEKIKNQISQSINKINNFDPEIKILEEKLKLKFGTPVKISREGRTGKIIIEFYSEEELKNIVYRITSNDKDI